MARSAVNTVRARHGSLAIDLHAERSHLPTAAAALVGFTATGATANFQEVSNFWQHWQYSIYTIGCSARSSCNAAARRRRPRPWQRARQAPTAHQARSRRALLLSLIRLPLSCSVLTHSVLRVFWRFCRAGMRSALAVAAAVEKSSRAARACVATQCARPLPLSCLIV